MSLWPLRALWFLAPIYFGPGVSELLASRSNPVATVVEVGLWLGWFVGLVALLAPSTVSLTVLRVIAPIPPVGLVLALAVDGNLDAQVALALAGSVISAGLAFLPTVGDQMVNGSAYGAERRLALRPPASALLGPVQLAWVVGALGLCVGPLLLAAQVWILGTIAVALGAVGLLWSARVLHQLSKRWIVFVPVGFVIHDYYRLAESILVRRSNIGELGPAPVEAGGAIDISAGAMGLALQVELTEPAPLALRNRGQVTEATAQRIVFTPSLPGRLLAEARIRGFKIARR